MLLLTLSFTLTVMTYVPLLFSYIKILFTVKVKVLSLFYFAVTNFRDSSPLKLIDMVSPSLSVAGLEVYL